MIVNRARMEMDTATFAAGRDKALGDSEEFLSQYTRRAILRIGLQNWSAYLIEGMMQVFDMTVALETDQTSPTIDDMRSEFRREIGESLEKAKKSDNESAQFNLINRWAATASVNAAVEAATTADPDERIGLEWITMRDEKVRHSHREVNGAVVPTGQAFTVGGQEMLYPGQPVGDPSEFLNCRCVVRPTMIGEMASMANSNFANQSDPEAQSENPSVVIVALPREGDPINSIASGEHPHITLAYLGDTATSQYTEFIEAVADSITTPITDKVSGRAELGKDSADVLLMDATGSKALRDALLAVPEIGEQVDAQDQFPTWIPHITIGYPDSPRLSDDKPESVTYDRFGLWRGGNVTEFPFNIQEESMVASGEGVTSAEDLPDGLIIPEDAFTEQVPWHAVLAPEGIPSGDGRQFSVGGLTHRKLPLPLKWMPSDKSGHDDSVVVGRIDRIFRNDQGMVCGEGVFDTSEDAYEAIRQIANSMVRGVSVDLDEMSGAVEIPREGDDTRTVVEVSNGVVASTTIVAIPAFSQAFIGLGHWSDIEKDAEPSGNSGEFSSGPGLLKDGTPPKCNFCDEKSTQFVRWAEGKAFVPACDDHIGDAEAGIDPDHIDNIGTYAPVPTKTKDGPGWITNPNDTERITNYWVDGRGAAKIGWGTPGDFNRCRANLAKYVQNPKWLSGLCANLHYRALRSWPGQNHATMMDDTTEASPAFSLVASASTEVYSADDFRNPGLDKPTPLTVTEDGRVFGHLAAWGTCHIGVRGACTTPPTSRSKYAYFLTGEVMTDAGSVSVGQITMGGGHADIRKNMHAALAHYDSTSAVVADITTGEDRHGIWVAGRLRSSVTPEQVHALRAAALSGDWRRVGGSLEMVAALAVNVPGFPIPRPSINTSGKDQYALTASAIVFNEVEVDAITDEVGVDSTLSSKLDRVSSARRTFRAIRAADARGRMNL